MDESDNEEVDYMTMALPVESKESTLGKRKAERVGSLGRSHPLSKRAKEAEAARNLQRGMGTNLLRNQEAIDRDSEALGGQPMKKGRALMERLGYTGGPLGRADATSSHRRTPSPVRVDRRPDRAGIGTGTNDIPTIDAQARIDVQKEVAQQAALRENESDFRKRMASESASRKAAYDLRRALTTGHQLWDEQSEKKHPPVQVRAVLSNSERRANRRAEKKVTDHTVRRRGSEEQLAIAMGEDVGLPLRRLNGEDESDDEAVDVENREEDEDLELTDWLDLPVADRLDSTLHWLRTKFNHCYWCGYTYGDIDMEGCPGESEDIH